VVSGVIDGILSIEARDMDTKLLSDPESNNTLARFPGQMTHIVTSLTLNNARSCVMQGAFITQGKASSIPTIFSWGGSISPDSFLPSILLLLVIIVVVVIVVVTVVLSRSPDASKNNLVIMPYLLSLKFRNLSTGLLEFDGAHQSDSGIVLIWSLCRSRCGFMRVSPISKYLRWGLDEISGGRCEDLEMVFPGEAEEIIWVDACEIGKQAHASHKAKNIVSTTRTLELLHMDLFGPSAVQSYGGNLYTLVIVDDYSRVFLLSLVFAAIVAGVWSGSRPAISLLSICLDLQRMDEG
ncbi:hypothetical protein Tco_1525505, partial [Tanacetum coccineum]